MYGKVSVIVPCYNQSLYLEDALNSIFTQEYKNWECIIVDDGSNDETKEVSAKWCERDERFKYVWKENGGLSSARNTGLDFATGDFIQFLDADDFIFPEKLKIQIALLNGVALYDVSVCDYYPSNEFDLTKKYEHGRYLSPYVAADKIIDHLVIDWEVKFSIPCHCFLFRAFLFKDKKIRFDETLPNHEDWDCWMQVFSFTNLLIYSKDVFAIYRIREKAMCSNPELMHKGFLMALEKQLYLSKNDKLKQIISNRIKYQNINQSIAKKERLLITYLRIFKNKLLEIYKTRESGL
jgi:glycosyltransferase involved in cell wall biosynthesis